jgi:hypothetical protein
MSSTTSADDMLINPGTIVTGLQSATTLHEVLALAGLAFADIAQQTGAISQTLDSVITAGAATQPGELNVAATINAGSTVDANVSGSIEANVSGAIGSTVTIDCLGKPAEELLNRQLSKAAHAVFHLWTMAQTRIGEFEVALDCSIGKVAKEICELKPLTGSIGNHLRELTIEIKEVKAILHEQQKCICDLGRKRGWYQATPDVTPANQVLLNRVSDIVDAVVQEQALEEMIEHLHPWASARFAPFAPSPGVVERHEDSSTSEDNAPVHPSPSRSGRHRNR